MIRTSRCSNLPVPLTAILLCAAAALCGCAVTPRTYGSLPGKATYIGGQKRYAEHEDVDLLHRFHRVAYTKTGALKLRGVSGDMQQVYDEFGKPDAVRRPFKSLQGERVNEWVYLEHGQVFQFIAGALVYQGPLTDSEIILMTYGYPDECIRSQHDPDLVNRMFRYTDFFSGNEKMFLLLNDALLYSQQGS